MRIIILAGLLLCTPLLSMETDSGYSNEDSDESFNLLWIKQSGDSNSKEEQLDFPLMTTGVSRYRCHITVCPFTTNDENDLREHIVASHVKSLFCAFLYSSSIGPRSLEYRAPKRVKTVTAEDSLASLKYKPINGPGKDLKCVVCSAIFENRNSLLMHIRDKHVVDDKNPQCLFSNCNNKKFVYASITALRFHWKKHHDVLIGCVFDSCDYQGPNSVEWATHIAMKHPESFNFDSTINMYCCAFGVKILSCSSHFLSKSYFIKHLEAHHASISAKWGLT